MNDCFVSKQEMPFSQLPTTIQLNFFEPICQPEQIPACVRIGEGANAETV
jgi:hypothetical protein